MSNEQSENRSTVFAIGAVMAGAMGFGATIAGGLGAAAGALVAIAYAVAVRVA